MSISFPCRYYSGQQSSQQECIAEVDEGGCLSLLDSDVPPVYFRELKISPRVGSSMRYLSLPDGATIETRSNDEIDQLINHWMPEAKSLVYYLERSSKAALLAVLLLFAGGYGFIAYGIPALSSTITALLPVSLDDRIGGEALKQLDILVFNETTLDADRQAELRSLFAGLIPIDERNYRLRFRASETLGANAFALTGDLNTAATTLLVILSSFLIQSRYTQNLEYSADSYALEQMLARGRDTNHFTDFMERSSASSQLDAALEIDLDSPKVEEGQSLLEYFSSHPASRLRIQRFRSASTSTLGQK